MNRRSLFRLLTGAAAAVGLGKVPELRPELMLERFERVDFVGPPPDVGDLVSLTYRTQFASALRSQVSTLVNFSQYAGRGGRRDSDLAHRSGRSRTARYRVLTALDASRNARLASRFNEAKA